MAKLYVIAGHGGGDPGAGGNGYEEHERVVALAKEIVARGGGQVDHYPYDSNAYADRAMDWLNPGCPIVELHMDAAGGSARGGHVIIASGAGGADSYDRALADLMGEVFPGRSNLIVERDNLRNPNVAKRRGLNYRLVENGFIDNATDIEIFNVNIGYLADRYLAAFGISSDGSGGYVEPSAPSGGSGVQNALGKGDSGDEVADLQRKLIALGYDCGGYGADGIFGAGTDKSVRDFQRDRGLVVDGLAGVNTMAALGNATSKPVAGETFPLPSGHWFGMPNADDRNHSGYYNEADRPAIQRIQSVVGTSADGYFGQNTHNATVNWQRDHGLTADGLVGINTWSAMF